MSPPSMSIRKKKETTTKNGNMDGNSMIKHYWSIKRVNPITQNNEESQEQQQKNIKNIEEQIENDFYRSLRIYLLIAQIFICAPMGVHRRQRPEESKYPWIISILIVIHILWCCTVYMIISIVIYLESIGATIQLPTVQQPLFYAEYLVYFLHIFVIMISTYKGRENFRRFPAILLDFDRQLLQWNIQPDYGELSNFCRQHFLLIFLHFTLAAITNFYYSGKLILPFLNSITVFMLPNIILEVSLVQLYTLLYAIAQRSEKLNRVLQQQLDLAKNISKDFMNISINDTNNADDDNLINLQNTFQHIRLFYSKLELFTNTVNGAFAPSVVLVYIGSFANLTVNLFLIYKFVDSADNSEWSEIFYSVIWTCMHIAKMYLILRYNQIIQTQKQITALLLNEVRGRNPAMEETITHFILQLIVNTRSNVVCGVAVLDMEFIPSLLVAVSTLFIFLLQYDITFEALSKSNPIPAPPTNSV